MADALAVVKVGNNECELAKRTPLAISEAMFGAVLSLIIAGRRPSATNSTTLCGRCCADAGDARAQQIAANVNARRYMKLPRPLVGRTLARKRAAAQAHVAIGVIVRLRRAPVRGGAEHCRQHVAHDRQRET